MASLVFVILVLGMVVSSLQGSYLLMRAMIRGACAVELISGFAWSTLACIFAVAVWALAGA